MSATDMEDKQVVGSGNCQDCMYRFDSDNGSKGLVEIKTSFLGIAFDDNPCFVLFKNIVSIAFDVADPSAK